MLSGRERKTKRETGEEEDVQNALRGARSKEASIRPHARDQVTLGSRQLFSGQELLERDGETRKEACRQTHRRCVLVIINIKWT
jgi:hypothetical protein